MPSRSRSWCDDEGLAILTLTECEGEIDVGAGGTDGRLKVVNEIVFDVVSDGEGAWWVVAGDDGGRRKGRGGENER